MTGAPVAAAVRAYVAEQRDADRARALAAARRLPVQLLFPLTLLVLPGFMVLTIGPALLAALERLGVIDPTDFPALEALRQEVVDVIEERLDEGELVPWSRADQQFHFLRSQIVVFDTGTRVRKPNRLADIIPRMSAGSVFYHFIDARRRTDYNLDDFRAWLWGFGDEYAPLIEKIAAQDPYFSTIAELRVNLSKLFKDYFSGRTG